MVKNILLFTLCIIWNFSYAQETLVQYISSASTTNPSISPSNVSSAVSANNLTAGGGITANTGTSYNWRGWDTDNASYSDAVADGDLWTWGFTVTTGPIDLNTMDIRLDRSGTGPDDIEIQASINGGGGISIMTYDYNDGGSAVEFSGVDLSGVPQLQLGDEVVFTLAAFNSESSAGTFDLENFGAGYGIDIAGTVATTPVNLDQFEVVADKVVAFVKWHTSSEINNNYFTVEHSLDGRTYIPIGKVNGSGTTYEGQSYSFEHRNPKEGTNYYRLRQTDYNGSSEIFPSESIYFQGNNGRLNVFPTQFSNEIYISNVSKGQVYKVINIAGGLVQDGIIQNEKEMLNLSHLSKGTYIMQVLGQGKISSFKIIKQ